MTRQVFFAGFSLTLAAALTYYINSSFLESIVGETRVGLIYALAAAAGFIFILATPRLARRYGLLWGSRSLAVIFFGGTLTLALSRTPIVQLLAFIITHGAIVCLGLWLDIYLETLSADRRTGRIRGGYLSVINAAILISPYLSGSVLNLTADSDLNYQIIYWLSLGAALPLLYQVFWRLAPRSLPIGAPGLRQKLRDRNLRKILALDFLLNLFYFFMVIYLPLHLVHQIGFSWANIGFIFTIMLLPFVLIQYPLGWLADRKFGEKEILTGGLIIAAIATIPIAFLTTKNIAIWAGLLFVTRIGASAIESMKETYLFKKVAAGDIGVIGLSRLTIPGAYLIGSIVSFLLLKIIPLSQLFTGLGLLILISTTVSFRLKDTN